MGFWDFTPAASGRKRPISKKELKKLQDNYKFADEISKKARELESEEKKDAQKDLDNLLSGID